MRRRKRKPQTQSDRVVLVAAGLDPRCFYLIRNLPNSIIVEDIRDCTIHIKEKKALGIQAPQ